MQCIRRLAASTSRGERSRPTHHHCRLVRYAFIGGTNSRANWTQDLPNASACYPFATRPDFGVAAYANNHNEMGITWVLGREFFVNPKADIGTQSRNVRFVPKADIWRHGVRRAASHEAGFTRKLKPYFSKTDFAVCERRNDKYCAASGLAVSVNATG